MKTAIISLILIITCLGALLIAIPIFGVEGSLGTGHRYDQQDRGQNSNASGDRGPRQPPQEAIAACEGKSTGDKVEFETPRGDTISGTCVTKGDLVFAIPEGGHQQSRGGQRQNRMQR